MLRRTSRPAVRIWEETRQEQGGGEEAPDVDDVYQIEHGTDSVDEICLEF